MVIDTHQHFWRFTEEEFGWIPNDMAAIRRDFMPADLAPILVKNRVDGVIAVQARTTEAETRWLLDLAQQHNFIRGVVGWLDLRSANIASQFTEFVGTPLVGLREILQGKPDAFMADPDFNRGLAALAKADLAYDLLIFEKQLPAAIALVDRHPELRFILDHFGKPCIDIDQLDPWKTNLRELAKRPNVVCKISGGITEAALDWTPARLRPYLDTALETFGPRRLVFGSNWPVCESAGGYAPWINALRSWGSALAIHEQQAIFGGNAIDFYRPRGSH
jgi:L-fuconolactonase